MPLAAGAAWGMRAKVTSLLGLALWASWIAGQSRPIVVGEAFFLVKKKRPIQKKDNNNNKNANANGNGNEKYKQNKNNNDKVNGIKTRHS